MATIFWLSVYGVSLVPLDEYNWTVCVRRWCSLMSNYFDCLFIHNCHSTAYS